MSEEAIEIPSLDDKVIRIGTLCAVFFLSVFLVPYIQGFLNGKLGFSSNTGGLKKFTISTMIDVSSKVLQVSIVFVFICFGNIYLAWQNFFETENDARLLVPICSYLFGIAMILLLWLPNSKYPSAHSALAILVFVSGTIFNTVIFLLYDKYYPENGTLSILRVNAVLAIVIFVVVVILAVVIARNTGKRIKIGKIDLVDLFAGLELIHVLVLSSTIFFVSSLPALPISADSCLNTVMMKPDGKLVLNDV